MIAHGKEIKVFCGNANRKFAEGVCAELGINLGDSEVKSFSDGEISVSVNETVRGCDVFVVQSTCTPVNDNLMELLQYQDPKNYRLALEALHAAHREDLIGTGPGCLLPPPGAKRAAPVKKPKTTRPVPEKRLHKAKRHR